MDFMAMEWNFQWDTDGKKWLKGYAETSQHSLLAVIVFLLIFKVDFFYLTCDVLCDGDFGASAPNFQC
jgi:hypothetical protein